MSEHDGSAPRIEARSGDRVLKTSVLAGIGIVSSICLCSCLILLYSVTWPIVARPQLADAATITNARLIRATETSAPPPTVSDDTVRVTATAQSVQATVVSLKRWDVVLADSFDDNRNHWPTGDYTGKLVEGKRTIIGGRYHWEALAYDSVMWRSFPSVQSSADFVLSVEITKISGSQDSTVGIIFREDETGNDYYLFEIDDEQDFHLERSFQDRTTNLISWRPSTALVSQGPNRLTISAEGSHLRFFANDQFLAEIDDNTVRGGWIGLSLQLAYADDTAVYEFDDLELRAPPVNVEATRTALAPTSQALLTRAADSVAKTATVRAPLTVAARATATQQAVATAQVEQTRIAGYAQWKNLLADSFDVNTNRWPTGPFTDAFATGSREIVNSKYRWDLKANQSGISTALVPGDQTLSDFSLAVQAQRIDGPKDTCYAVVFRYVDPDNYHVFRITDDRSFIFQSVIGGTVSNSGTWTQTRAIQSGGVNQLRVTAQGSHFSFYINGEKAGEADDNRLPSGKVGLAAGLFASGEQARVEFDTLELRYP